MNEGKIGTKRIIVYVVGLFFYSLGIALTAKTDLGIAPISTFPYALSFILPFSFGICTFFLTITYILIQIVLLGKEFEKRQYLQIVVGILFSTFVDFSMFILSPVNPESYISRLIILIIGCFILAFGITLSVIPNVIIPPAEGAINAIAKKLNKNFGNVKIAFDSTVVILAIIVSLIFLGRLEGFKEGTIISVFVTGYFTKIQMKVLRDKIEKICRR